MEAYLWLQVDPRALEIRSSLTNRAFEEQNAGINLMPERKEDEVTVIGSDKGIGGTSPTARRFRRFVRDDKAAVTVEFVLWLPLFIIILFLIVEVSLLFLTQSSMWNVARDTARRISTHEFGQAAAETYATGAMTFGGHPYTIVADAAGPEVSVTITTSVGDVLLFSYSPMAAFAGSQLVARVILREEPE